MMSEEDVKEPVNVNDIVRKRLEDEAKSSVEGLLKNESAQGIDRSTDDLSRPITLGEARKLVGEINGSFDKIKEWVSEINNILNNQGQYIQKQDASHKLALEEIAKIAKQVEAMRPLPLPDSKFKTN